MRVIPEIKAVLFAETKQMLSGKNKKAIDLFRDRANILSTPRISGNTAAFSCIYQLSRKNFKFTQHLVYQFVFKKRVNNFLDYEKRK